MESFLDFISLALSSLLSQKKVNISSLMLTSFANHSESPLGVLKQVNNIFGEVLMMYSNSTLIFSMVFIVLVSMSKLKKVNIEKK